MGVIAWVLLIPAALFVRPRPPAARRARRGRCGGATPSTALRSPQFAVLGGTFFLCCAAHAGPIFHTISYAKLCGISTMAAVSIYSVEGLAGLVGRIFFGLGADRYGARPALITALVIQALVIPLYLGVRDLGGFYAMALVLGMVYGGGMPLYAVLARDYFGQAVMGTVLGAATMLSALGMALGPLGGGWIYDRFGSYVWLYIASGLLAAGAVAVSFAFPPSEGERRRRTAAA